MIKQEKGGKGETKVKVDTRGGGKRKGSKQQKQRQNTYERKHEKKKRHGNYQEVETTPPPPSPKKKEKKGAQQFTNSNQELGILKLVACQEEKCFLFNVVHCIGTTQKLRCVSSPSLFISHSQLMPLIELCKNHMIASLLIIPKRMQPQFSKL